MADEKVEQEEASAEEPKEEPKPKKKPKAEPKDYANFVPELIVRLDHGEYVIHTIENDVVVVGPPKE